MGKMIRVCPRCRSPKIKDVNLIFGWTPAIYQCDNCGYRGPMILEVDEDKLKKFIDK